MSPESFLLPACCSLPWLPSRSQAYWWWNHGPHCSALWVITQISSPKVELATGSTVVHVSPLLEANSAVPELVEGSGSGPQLPHGSQPLAGSSGACLPLTSPSWTWALRPEPLACPAISSYFSCGAACSCLSWAPRLSYSLLNGGTGGMKHVMLSTVPTWPVEWKVRRW